MGRLCPSALQDVSSLKDFFETNLDLADPDALMGAVRAAVRSWYTGRPRLPFVRAPASVASALPHPRSTPGLASFFPLHVARLGTDRPSQSPHLHPNHRLQMDHMTGRKGSCLPPATMHDTELDRVIVGDGSGTCWGHGCFVVSLGGGCGWVGGWGGWGAGG